MREGPANGRTVPSRFHSMNCFGDARLAMAKPPDAVPDVGGAQRAQRSSMPQTRAMRTLDRHLNADLGATGHACGPPRQTRRSGRTGPA